MIKGITIINNLGQRKEIDLGAPETSGLWIKSIKGIGPGKATINVTDLATSDGGIYNSSRSETRNITMTIGFVEWYTGLGTTRITHTVEEVRRDLYKWFAKKRPIDFIINLEQLVKISDTEYYTKRINLGASGYVESNEPDIFNKQETAAISIICPDPNMYLYDDLGRIMSDSIDFSATNDGFELLMDIIQTTDTSFLPDKVYYEKIGVDTYTITEDEEMMPGKTYYEEIPISEELRGIKHYPYDPEHPRSVDIAEFVITNDTSFLPNKDYYEFKSGQYVKTTDSTMIEGKTYYELIGYYEEKCNEGFENNIDETHGETEYFLTEDTEPKVGKEYFLKNGDDYYPVGDVFVPTTDTSMDSTKTYYELVNNEYIITEDESFDPEKTYYELVGITQLSVLDPNKYYEYRSKKELATLTTIAVKEIDYDGEIEIGVSFVIYISGEVSGLSLYKIYDAYNYETISIDDSALSLDPSIGGGLNAGDEIRICTVTGNKSAVLIREATEHNIMNALGRNPAWFKLDQGINRFSYGATSGSENVSINIEYYKAYEGV